MFLDRTFGLLELLDLLGQLLAHGGHLLGLLLDLGLTAIQP